MSFDPPIPKANTQRPEGFHAKNGWYFKRTDDGRVMICSPENTVVLDAGTWASAVASVSGVGDTVDSFARAKYLHEATKL